MPARKFTDEQEKQIATEYLTRNNDGTWTGAVELARRWGTSHLVIYHALKRQQVVTRNSVESHAHGKRCKPIKNLPDNPENPPLCACGCKTHVKWSHRKNRWQAYVRGHRGNPPYNNHDFLYEQYIIQGKSMIEIARMFNTSEGSISRYLRLQNIPIRNVVECHIGTQVGENNPAWKGGVTPERQRLYKSQEWKTLVKGVFKRDGYNCQNCGGGRVKGINLHAHHIKSFASYPNLRFDPSNLITLCSNCHLWVHSKANVHHKWIE